MDGSGGGGGVREALSLESRVMTGAAVHVWRVPLMGGVRTLIKACLL